VTRNQVLARIEPAPLDPRQRQEASARVDAAKARYRQSLEQVEQARTRHQLALREADRAERLVQDGTISAQVADQKRSAASEADRELSAAQFNAQAAAEDVKVAEAALLAVSEVAGSAGTPVVLRSPIAARVLRIIEKSDRVVTPGLPLLMLGDPSRLEVVIDVLSSDAVKINAGAPVLLVGWGGSQALRAVVRTVEPYAFTKTSALGVEEQRVNVIVDFIDPPGPLADGYRVEAQIILWESSDVLKVPVGALFRQNDRWAVFVVAGDRAQLLQIGVGHLGSEEAQVLAGLNPGDVVISHPPNDLQEGARISRR
jgi:HlyD family secretion protein